MKTVLNNLTLAVALFSLPAAAIAAGPKDYLPELQGRPGSSEMKSPGADNTQSEEALVSTVESYLDSASRKGPYEDNIKARLKAIDAIWSLGEIGDPKLMASLTKFYSETDSVIKVNLIISMGKLKKAANAGPYLSAIADSVDESEAVRAAAFEVLAEIGQAPKGGPVAPSKNISIEKGDIIFTGGIGGTLASFGSSDLPIGHAGIFGGTEIKNGKINVMIMDCVPDSFNPGGVRNITSWKNFTHHFKFPFYGNRTTNPKPTAAQREKIVKMALAMGKLGLHYSDSHVSQKGPTDFDCVGYVEYLYEHVGLNPTDDSYETGLGWPLTPFEQFMATTPNVLPQVPFAPKPAAVSAPSAAVYNTLNSLPAAFGLKGQLPDINSEVEPATAD